MDMHKILFKAVLFVLGCSICSSLWSQACCSGGTPLAGNLGIQNYQNDILSFQLTYDYNTQRDLFNESDRLDDDNRIRNTHSLVDHDARRDANDCDTLECVAFCTD